MTHTPGPWFWNGGENTIHRDAIDGLTIATAYDLRHDTNGDEAEANARLIAAAPDLLRLLKQAAFVVESVAHLRGMEKELLPLADEARAVIAQATGDT